MAGNAEALSEAVRRRDEIIDQLVSGFKANDCEPLGDPSGELPAEVRALVECLRELTPLDEHAVRWDPDSWARGLESRRDLPDRDRLLSVVARLAGLTQQEVGHWIRRREVFDLADGDVVDLFVATMAWGYGRGWGWYRTAKIIELATKTSGRGDLQLLTEKLKRLAEFAGSGSTVDLFAAWSDTTDPARLRRFGPAFASKFAYFAGYDRTGGTGPLIADLWVAWALWALADIWDARTDSAKYIQYLTVAGRWADDGGCRSDEIERALFYLGPPIRRA